MVLKLPGPAYWLNSVGARGLPYARMAAPAGMKGTGRGGILLHEPFNPESGVKKCPLCKYQGISILGDGIAISGGLSSQVLRTPGKVFFNPVG